MPAPPERLQPLIEALASAHRGADERAIRYGHRYRSGFWAIYLLSAFAVFCAVMPMALGWDTLGDAMHPFAGVWVVGELVVIATVLVIYWRGHRSDWQGEWLRARTSAELTSYLPLLAPLVDFSAQGADPNWYLRVLDPGQHLRASEDVPRLCQMNEPKAREHLAGAWSEPQFVSSYAQWAMAILQAQKNYHARTAARSHALLHRVHQLTIGLFALTGLGALAHLFIHSRRITLLTTFFPALAAALHGALAQSEAYRLHATSERVAADLQVAIDDIRSAAAGQSGESIEVALRRAVQDAIALILEEHQDWHMLVRPHHLPLA
jgi:hypothetical protein